MATKKETVPKPPPNSYNPSRDELNDAISLVLKQETTRSPSTKSVLNTIQTEKPTWKLPERRVSKFLKKQLNDTGKEVETAAETLNDDEESHTSRVKLMAQGTKAKLSSFFRRGKKKNENVAPIAEEPPTQVHVESPQDTLLPAVSSDSECGDHICKELAQGDEIPEPEKDLFEKEADVYPELEKDLFEKEADVYQDDNVETKEEQCCGACAIL